jgi:hypothetical protein
MLSFLSPVAEFVRLLTRILYADTNEQDAARYAPRAGAD